MGSDALERQSGCGVVINPGRDRQGLIDIHYGVLGVGLGCFRGGYPVANSKIFDAFAHRFNGPGGFCAGSERVLNLVDPAALVGLDEVDAGRRDLDQQLACAWDGRFD